MKFSHKILTIIILSLSLSSFAQKKYYKINGGKTTNEESYLKIKEGFSEKGKIEELKLKTENKKDSTINHVRINIITKTPDGKYFDPYSETKKSIGSKFQIENFLNSKSKKFSKNYLKGKPTLINFWFTKCPPCIDEIPLLNQLEKKLSGKANFLTITFDSQETVDRFLNKKEFNFEHITNSKKQIDNLGISAYPTSLILDKNGIIKFVFGEITYDIKDIEIILENL